VKNNGAVEKALFHFIYLSFPIFIEKSICPPQPCKLTGYNCGMSLAYCLEKKKGILKNLKTSRDQTLPDYVAHEHRLGLSP